MADGGTEKLNGEIRSDMDLSIFFRGQIENSATDDNQHNIHVNTRFECEIPTSGMPRRIYPDSPKLCESPIGD
jgi:hypothetical protein